MPNLRLTRRIIDDIPFAACGQMLYRDTLLSGFGLRVGSRSKVYFAEGQVNRETRHVTIGARTYLWRAQAASRLRGRAHVGQRVSTHHGRNDGAGMGIWNPQVVRSRSHRAKRPHGLCARQCRRAEDEWVAKRAEGGIPILQAVSEHTDESGPF